MTCLPMCPLALLRAVHDSATAAAVFPAPPQLAALRALCTFTFEEMRWFVVGIGGVEWSDIR